LYVHSPAETRLSVSSKNTGIIGIWRITNFKNIEINNSACANPKTLINIQWKLQDYPLGLLAGIVTG
jgi:hypothetical protein